MDVKLGQRTYRVLLHRALAVAQVRLCLTRGAIRLGVVRLLRLSRQARQPQASFTGGRGDAPRGRPAPCALSPLRS